MKAGAQASFPGFDGLRLLAAWAVVYSHSYPIAAGPSVADPLASQFGEPYSFGLYAVKVFFMMSGFLLSASLSANPDPLRFLANRLFRIVPGFCFAIIVSQLFIAPLLSSSGFWEIITSSGDWMSIFWSIRELRDLTGVELSASRYPELARFLNGSLWTISYEMVCYLVVLALYQLLRKESRVAVAALVLLVLTVVGSRFGVTADGWSGHTPATVRLPYSLSDSTLPYFCGGVLFHACHRRWGARLPLVAASLAVLLGTFLLGLHDLALALAGPVVVTWLGARRSVLSRLTERTGDISYGVYLFGWPVSLLVTSLSDSSHPLVVFALSAPVVFTLAYAMHRLVEVPIGTVVKPWVFRWLPRFSPGEVALPRGRRVAQFIAESLCLVVIGRFLVFPYPFGANWYDSQWQPLAGLCLLMALILRLGERAARAQPGPV